MVHGRVHVLRGRYHFKDVETETQRGDFTFLKRKSPSAGIMIRTQTILVYA